MLLQTLIRNNETKFIILITKKSNKSKKAEGGHDCTCSVFDPLTNFSFLNQDLLYVGTTRNNNGNSSCSYTWEANQWTGLEHTNFFDKMVTPTSIISRQCE